MKLLYNYDFPGNIRELANIVERCVILAENNIITPADLPFDKEQRKKIQVSLDLFSLPLNEADAEFQRRYIINLLERNKGNISKSAKGADIHRTSLLRKMKTLDIQNKHRNKKR